MSRKEVSLNSEGESPKKPRKAASTVRKAPIKLRVLNETGTPRKITIRKKQPGAVLSPIQFTAADKVTKREITKKSKTTEDSDVIVPHTMSIRAREKALAILQKMTEDFEASAEKFSYISGLALVLLGGSMALLSAGFLPSVQHQLSQVVNTASTTTNTLTNATSAVTVPMPVFTITTLLPAELHGTADSVFTITYADNIDARLYNLDSGKVTTLSLDSPAAHTFHFKVDQTRLEPGHYILNVAVRALADQAIHTFRGDNFIVPAPVVTAMNATIASTTASASRSGTSGTPGITSTTSTAANTTPTQAITTTSSTTQQTVEFKVSLPSSTISGNSIVRAIAPANATAVAFFIRPVNTITLSPLGSATKGADYWYFLFNTINRTNGDYEILARTNNNGAYVTSNPVRVRIENAIAAPVPAPVPTPTPVPAPAPTPTPTSVQTSDNISDKQVVKTELPKAPPIKTADTTVRTFADLNNDAASTEKSGSVQISKETEDAFAQHRDQLNELLKRYSVAVQSGNPITIQIALHEIETAKAKIISDAMKNPDSNKEVGTLTLELSDRLDVLKTRVDTFEKLRSSSSKVNTNVDTDGDGISDFDEINLYHTDPHQADTDHDGFLDGTEIMKGFDPLSAKPETPIIYEMPQQSLGLVHEDILKVEDVKPLIKHDETGKVEEIQAEIHGRSLPNSYVTLYIFSTPVVVTVRTDQDGSFVYNFEKELADGQHEVYVAVTDNTGAIVARSNPFKFVKEAQAFTPVDTAHAETADSQSLSDLKLLNMYNVAIGLGILAFGVVLLMLGVGMRKKREDEQMILPA